MIKLSLPAFATIVVAAGLASAAGIASATATRSNGLLAYQTTIGDHSQLFTIKPDGTDPHQLTHWADSDAINAAWSPDGSKIVFSRLWKSPERQRFYTINADGTALRGLDPKLRGVPIWLPDGKHLLAVRNLRAVIVNPDGTGARDAGIPGLPGDVCFLGSSGQLADLVSRSDGDNAVFIGRIGGGRGSLKRITPFENTGDKIDCSPDGSRVLFSAPNTETAESGNVYTVKPDGTGLRKLTHNVGGKIQNGADSWSPDGRKIAFVSNRTGTFEIYSMNADGTHVTQITHGPEAHLASWGSHP